MNSTLNFPYVLPTPYVSLRLFVYYCPPPLSLPPSFRPQTYAQTDRQGRVWVYGKGSGTTLH